MNDPDFILFTLGDSSNPKDGQMNYDEWKVEALKVMPLATEKEL